MLQDIENKKGGKEFAIGSDACETTIHETTQEDINDLLESGVVPAPDENLISVSTN